MISNDFCKSAGELFISFFACEKAACHTFRFGGDPGAMASVGSKAHCRHWCWRFRALVIMARETRILFSL